MTREQAMADSKALFGAIEKSRRLPPRCGSRFRLVSDERSGQLLLK
jgi:hypothetical protein